MAKVCAQCGKSLSFLQRLGSDYCAECQAEINRKLAEVATAEAAEKASREKLAAKKRYAAALLGQATAEELAQLDADGYLIAGNKLILCPVCGHDRFHQRRTLLNTRAATFFNLDWADSGADTRICELCTHVMLFARG